MKEDKLYYEACLKRIDNNLKHFYAMMQNIQEWHQTMGVRMTEMEMKVDKLLDMTKPVDHTPKPPHIYTNLNRKKKTIHSNE